MTEIISSIEAEYRRYKFDSVCFPAMKMNSVSEITGTASLMLFLATETGSALPAPVIRVSPTVFFVAKTIRSLTVILCFTAEQHCFLQLQHCSAIELICFIAWKFFSLNEVALPGPEQHCFGVKQHCFLQLQHYIGAKQHWFFKKQCGFPAKRRCFFMNQHGFVTKRLCSVAMQPGSGSGTPCFSRETCCSVRKTLASGAESSRSKPDQPASERDTHVQGSRQLSLISQVSCIFDPDSRFEREPIFQVISSNQQEPNAFHDPNRNTFDISSRIGEAACIAWSMGSWSAALSLVRSSWSFVT